MLGAFITDRDSNTRLDSDSGQGTDIDMEDDLGLESSTNVARIGGYLWLGRRHRFDAAYFDLSRSAAIPIQETIDFGDETFVINTALNTEADLTIVKADYTFAALARDRGFLGITAGLYVAETGFALSQPSLGRAESEDVTAPLPLLGLRGDYQWSSDGTPFFLRPYIKLRGVEAMRYQGDEMASAEIEARWQWRPRWSLVGAAGYGRAHTDRELFSATRDVASGAVGFRYQLARLFGMHAGMDLGFSDGTTAIYFQIGNAWFRP